MLSHFKCDDGYRRSPGRRLRRQKHSGRSQPSMEPLERRVLLSTWTVNTLSDAADPNDGVLSLREAIAGAVSGDTVNFAASLSGTIPIGSEIPIFDKHLTIDGPGQSVITLDSGGSGRVFRILGSDVSIDGLTIANGRTDRDGGGIYSSGGLLTVSDSTFTGNTAVFTTGGAIRAEGGLVLNNSTITGNSAPSGGSGGGLALSGTSVINNSTISNNSSGGGGGIYNNGGTLTITNSTISGNSTPTAGASSGGGIYNLNGTVTLVNSTLSGNLSQLGGGFYNLGTATLNNVTISGNSASDSGAGLYVHASGTLTANNTLVSANTGADDIFGSLASASAYNLIGTGGGLTNGVNGNQVGVTNPQLGAPQNNGGATATMALLSGSPALNAGSNALIPSGTLYDQRGVGYARIAHTTVDIGAYEENANLAPVANAQSVTTNEDTSVTVSLSGTDGDGDPLTYVVASLPAYGTLYEGTTAVASGQVLTGNQVVYVPAANANDVTNGGTDSFTFQVSDGVATSAAATVAVSVTAVNDVPVLVSGSVGPVTISAVSDASPLFTDPPVFGPGGGSDEASQTLTYTVTASPRFPRLFLADGITRVMAGQSYTLQEIQGIVVRARGPATTGTFSFLVQDSLGGSLLVDVLITTVR